jgi:hypothetical protein
MVTASNYHAPLQTEVDTFDTMREVSCFIVFSSAHMRFCVAQLFCNRVHYVFLEL